MKRLFSSFAIYGLVCTASSLAQMDHSHMPAMPNSTATQQGTPTQKRVDGDQPAMPFGTTADRQGGNAQRSVPATPTPLRLGPTVQEPEHPERRSGSTDTPVPSLLEDLSEREARPLHFFEQLALANNPTLRQARAQVVRLRAQAKQQGLWSNPEVGYEADHIRGGSYHSGEQGGYVQQTIPLAGQRSAARAAVQQQAVQAEAIVKQQETQVEAGVKLAFYNALAMQSEVELRTRLVEVAADATTTMHRLGNIGQADAPDMLQSEVEREQAKLELASAQRGYRKAFVMLAALSGDAQLPVAPLQGELADIPHLGEITAEQVAAASPQLATAQADVHASEAVVRSARRQQMPQLTLHAGLQQDNEPLESSRGRVGVVGVAQAGITLPLWNRNQGAVESARAGVLESQAEAARTHLHLQAQAEQMLQDYANAEQQVQQYRDELLPRATRAFELYQQKFMTMAAAYPQVLLSQRTLFGLQLEYVHALNAVWQSAIPLQHGLLQDGLQAPATVRPRLD